MDYRLKIQAPLKAHLEFRFTYFDDRNFDILAKHHVLELVAKPWRRIGFSVYGEPDFHKRRDNTGLALMLWPQPNHELRVFNTFAYVTLLKRNVRPDVFIEPFLPYARGVVGRLFSDDSRERRRFLEYALRYETKTKWFFPIERYFYRYWRAFASAKGGQRISGNQELSFGLSWDRKFEARDPLGTASATSGEAWTTTRFLLSALERRPAR